MNTEQLTVCDLGNDLGKAEHRLWCAVLVQLASDARLYWQGKTPPPVAHHELEQAFDDLFRCGPMLRHVCEHTGHNAQWLSKGFIAWCENDMA